VPGPPLMECRSARGRHKPGGRRRGGKCETKLASRIAIDAWLETISEGSSRFQTRQCARKIRHCGASLRLSRSVRRQESRTPGRRPCGRILADATSHGSRIAPRSLIERARRFREHSGQHIQHPQVGKTTAAIARLRGNPDLPFGTNSTLGAMLGRRVALTANIGVHGGYGVILRNTGIPTTAVGRSPSISNAAHTSLWESCVESAAKGRKPVSGAIARDVTVLGVFPSARKLRTGRALAIAPGTRICRC